MLFAASLLRTTLPADPMPGTGWVKQGKGRITAALSIMPFAGSCFLWFIGVRAVVRDPPCEIRLELIDQLA